MSKYKCLVLDHDDTVVRSTPTIHYPSFVEALSVLRPEIKPYTLEEFVGYCFKPGFFVLCKDILGMNEEEFELEQQIWRQHTKEVIPPLYEGFKEIIEQFRNNGGHICVVSHSEKDQISKHYLEHFGFVPELIYGWEQDEDKRKPHPFPLIDIMDKLKLKPSELLMVDDLKPGLDMANSCSVDFAAAGWSHIVEDIKTYMQEHSTFYFNQVKDLKCLVLE